MLPTNVIFALKDNTRKTIVFCSVLRADIHSQQIQIHARVNADSFVPVTSQDLDFLRHSLFYVQWFEV
jgi:hypothetical protein